MRLALLSAAALLALLALGALLWLRAPSRGTGAEPARVAEPMAAQTQAQLAPVEVSAGAERVSAEQVQEGAARSALEPSASQRVAADLEPAEVLIRAVADEDGAPLRDVQLHSEPWPEPAGGKKVSPPVHTDELGLARFRLPPGGVRIGCRTQLDRALVLDLAPGEEREAVMRLRRDADVEFHLRIVDAQTGEPLAGAGVEVPYIPGTAGLTIRAFADQGGHVALRLPSWTVLTGRVSREGYSTESVQLAGSHSTAELAKRVQLARAARVEGLVLDGGGAPAAEAQVTVSASDWDLRARNPDALPGAFGATALTAFEGVTSNEGRYALDVAPDVDLLLEIAWEGELVLQQPLHLLPGEVRVVDLRMAESGTIGGVVVDADGMPEADASVALALGTAPRVLTHNEWHFGSATSDADGRFAFSTVPPGTWLVGLLDVEAQVVEVPPGGSTVEVVLHTAQGLFIEGRCVGPDGEPVGPMFVWTVSGESSVTVQSDAEGVFALGPLLSGAYGLRVGERDGLVASEPVLAQAGDRDVVLRLGHASVLRGTVADAAGQAQAAQIQLILKNPGGIEEFSFHQAGEDGRFEIGRLGAGTYALLARTASGLVSAPRTVTIPYGDEATLDLLVEQGGRVHLLLPSGAIALVQAGGEAVDFGLQGDATTRSLPPGPIAVEVWKDDAVLARRDVTAVAGMTLELDLR